jgi:uncharacterized membrane protein (DUF106 family)
MARSPSRSGDVPLPSEEEETEGEKDEGSDDASDSEEEAEEEEPEAPSPPTRPPAPQFKLSTFVLVFLFILGIWMLFDNSTRNSVASAFGLALKPVIGFNGQFLLLTMFLAAIVEMLLTAIAYNWTTDWVKVAKVQAWQKAFRPLQLKAMRSGKKDRMDAIKPFQSQLTKLSSEMSMAQLKGMAVTWFLVIAIYTWVGLFIAANAPAVVNLGGASVDLLSHVGGLPVPYWFLIFSVYTVPMSLLFRRFLKHYSLRRYADSRPPTLAGTEGTA